MRHQALSSLILLFFFAAAPALGSHPDSEALTCADRSVSAKAVRTTQDVQAFVQCAREFLEEVGEDKAYDAFHNDTRWKSGPIYIFITELIPDGTQARSLVHAGRPERETTDPAMLGDRTDTFGTDYIAEAVRIIRANGGGFSYYGFENYETGLVSPKVSYLLPVSWRGIPAMLGSGIYLRDLPGTCRSEEVNAMELEADPSDERLQEFVRCAAMELEAKGYFATITLATDPRWKHGSIYLFGLDTNGYALFSGDPDIGQPGAGASELNDMMDGPFGGRDVVSVGDAFGETLLYYTARNPGNDEMQNKVTFVKRVVANGLPVLIGAGYYPGYVPRPDYGTFPF